jgi:hypothetical protein
VGPDAFLPCTLEAQEKTLRELDILAPNLQDMLKAAKGFAGDTKSTRHATPTCMLLMQHPTNTHLNSSSMLVCRSSAHVPATPNPKRYQHP